MRAPGRRASFAAGAAAAAGLLVIGVVLSGAMLQAQASREAAAALELHTVQVQLQTAKLLGLMQDAETGQRGYLLTRDPVYLVPYDRAREALPAQLDTVAALTRDNPVQQRHIAAMRALTAERLGRLAFVLAPARRGDFAAAQAQVAQGHGLRIMNSIRAEISEMTAVEQRLLETRRAASRAAGIRARNWLYAGLAMGALLMALAAAGAGAAISAARGRREAATRARVAEAVNAELESRVEAATRELRETEGQLRQSQKMEAIGHLTGGVAHDFNNMLAVVMGSLEMASRRLARGQPDIQRFLDNAMEGARRGALLTQRLLAFARQQPLNPTTIDANGLVSSMSEFLRHTLGERVRLETVLAGGLWKARADAHQLESAIVNLAVNARDAMGEDGRLTVETANAHLDDAYAAENDVAAGQYVVVAITDTGAGMSPEVAARAIEPFFTTKGVGKGTGLGLSQVFGFAKQSGGHLKIYSEPGHGTTVKLYLPRDFGAAEAPREAAGGAAQLPAGRPDEIILVVEDEDQVRRMSVDALRDLGYTVVHAANGPAALAELERLSAPTLLFTDVIMPQMNGRELADAARARSPGLKVLYTTGYTRNAIIHDGQLDPGVAFLSKPFTLAQLAAKVRETIDAD